MHGDYLVRNIGTKGKLIVVDISDQWLYAFENGKLVFKAPVSTGRDGFNTPLGTFSIFAKYPKQTMRGSEKGESWVVPDVPHVMYITMDGVALHGAYWHNQFGTGVRRSRGCVNLPLDSAAWLYNWAPLNTGTGSRVNIVLLLHKEARILTHVWYGQWCGGANGSAAPPCNGAQPTPRPHPYLNQLAGNLNTARPPKPGTTNRQETRPHRVALWHPASAHQLSSADISCPKR